MAVTKPDFLSEWQWWQIRVMRFGLYFLTIQAVLVGGGCGVYLAAVVHTDRRARALRMSTSLHRH